MKKLIVCALALGLVHIVYCATSTSTEAETTSMETSTAAGDMNNNNTAFGIIHGKHSGYNVWMFLATATTLAVILANQMLIR